MCNKRWVREVIGKYMVNLAEMDDRVVAVSADLFRSCRMENYMDKFPDRLYNTGIAEQDMIGFASGLCMEGFLPYTFSMGAFMSMRACEQIRTDVAYGNLNVRMVAVYSGVSGGLSGATHWSIEDCGIMTSIPNVTVLEPSDGIQAQKMMQATLHHKGPIYIRVSVVPSVDIYRDDYEYEIGRASVVKDGDDAAVICSGTIVQYALEAAELIEQEVGAKVSVIDMHTIKPIDCESVRRAAKTGRVIVAQDHNITGGLGYAVAAEIAKNNYDTKFKILGINDSFVPMARPDYLYRMFDIDAEGIRNNILEMLS